MGVLIKLTEFPLHFMQWASISFKAFSFKIREEKSFSEISRRSSAKLPENSLKRFVRRSSTIRDKGKLIFSGKILFDEL